MRRFSTEGHTAQAFDAELNEVKHQVMSMGGLVESMVDNGLKALLTMDEGLGRQVMVLSIIKTITDLERIGDEAEKLGRIGVKLSNEVNVPAYYKDLRHLGEHVQSMLRDALDSFARTDVESAFHTAARDEAIDIEYANFTRLLITHMMENPATVKHALDVSWCARSLERIADHACNICEAVIYLVEGQDVRHSNLDEMRKKLSL